MGEPTMRRGLRKPLIGGVVIATWAAGCYVGGTESENARKHRASATESTTFVPVEAGDQPPLPPNSGPYTGQPNPGDDDDDVQPPPDAGGSPPDSGGSAPTDAAAD